MSKNKYGHGNKLRPMFIVLVSIFSIIILANVSSAILDCSMCHKTVPGKATIKAADTIEINKDTCLKCHNPDYPPKPIGYNTHLAHVGKYSANVDYFSRHPKAIESLSCESCHVNIGENCKNCHVKNIPHIEPPLGNNCKGCHGELDKLFQHPSINLKNLNIHNVFGLDNTTACTMCHNSDNMASLRLASGEIVPIEESHKLCYQCHSNYYRLWDSGSHHVNKTVLSNADIIASGGDSGDIDTAGVRASLEAAWVKENTCINCHNPHNPSELYQMGVLTTIKPTGTDLTTTILYAGIVLFLVVAVAIIVAVKKKKLKLSDLTLSNIKLFILSTLSLFKLKLSALKSRLLNLKLPKISIPISISIETSEQSDKVDNVDKVDKVEKSPGNVEKLKQVSEQEKPDNRDKATEGVVTETIPKAKKNKFFQKYKYDIMFLLVICTLLGLFYVIFGAFLPMVVVVSESMSPHIEKGDIIFYTDISKISKIETYDEKNSLNFEDYGNVILYRPFGQENVVPYIHRARYYVNQGDEMWPGGTKAPYAGYITKGDNVVTNSKYDQQVDISMNTPVKKEWIVGVAKFRIPYIGYIRMIFP